MRWRGRRQSSNVEDQTGGLGLPMGGTGLGMPIGKGGLGCGGLIVVIVLALVFGLDPMRLIGEGSAPRRETPAAVPGQGEGCERSATHAFACTVLADTEDAWNTIFAQSGCDVAQTATGPFYCPSDNKIYLDISFFDDLDQKLGATGDFADAYVIAHEVGHHVQMLTGIADDVRLAQARASSAEANALQVQMELQADCYAGVWARSVQRQLEPGDIEEALTAAGAIGDDRLQRRSQGYVVPDSFTHGTSAERVFWLQRGYGTGDPADCDTFTVERL